MQECEQLQHDRASLPEASIPAGGSLRAECPNIPARHVNVVQDARPPLFSPCIFFIYGHCLFSHVTSQALKSRRILLRATAESAGDLWCPILAHSKEFSDAATCCFTLLHGVWSSAGEEGSRQSRLLLASVIPAPSSIAYSCPSRIFTSSGMTRESSWLLAAAKNGGYSRSMRVVAFDGPRNFLFGPWHSGPFGPRNKRSSSRWAGFRLSHIKVSTNSCFMGLSWWPPAPSLEILKRKPRASPTVGSRNPDSPSFMVFKA